MSDETVSVIPEADPPKPELEEVLASIYEEALADLAKRMVVQLRADGP